MDLEGIDIERDNSVIELRMRHGLCNEIGTVLLQSLEQAFDDIAKSDCHVLIMHVPSS